MPRIEVHSAAQSTATPDAVWAVVKDFTAAWHPAVEEMIAERSAGGGLIRKFRVAGEDTVYRERLTYYSDTERAYAYSHVAGIAGVTRYDARLSVEEWDGGAVVRMSAELVAPSPRAEEIAQGTQAIFDEATTVIAELANGNAGPVEDPSVRAASWAIEHISVEGLPRLSVSIAGKASDTVCLFLHGIGGNSSNWDQQLSAMAPLCLCAAMDLRGYGSSSLGPEPSRVEDYCTDILKVMEVLGADRLVLCGLSYGAWIATSFAMRHPKKLAALVLSGGCTGMSEARLGEREAFRMSREVPMNEGKTPADFAPDVVDVISGPGASAAVRASLQASMAAIPTGTYADALRCFTSPTEQFEFAKLTMPVLMMTGEHDRLAPPAEIKAVAQRIWENCEQPDVRFEIIRGAGHVCNIERPKVYDAYLGEFLARVLT